MEPGPLLTSRFFPPEVQDPVDAFIDGQEPGATAFDRSSSANIHDFPSSIQAEEAVFADDPSLPRVILPPEGISIEAVEKAYIMQALTRYRGNQTRAAKCLGMSLDTLRYRRKKFGLENYPNDEHEASASAG